VSRIQLHSGRFFDFENPVAPSIADIAHGLSHICRFTGHVKQFYSVAEHSVHVSRIVPPELALAGLMHDASEALLGDVSAPLKALLPDYKRLEARVEAVVFERYGIEFNSDIKRIIKRADLVLLATEQRDLMPPCDERWESLLGIEPLAQRITPMAPPHARLAFMLRYKELTSPA
jgi:uncharacterized protein